VPVEERSGGDDEGPGRRERDFGLLAGIRRAELKALHAFVKRFDPILLDQARRLGIDRPERRILVTEFLDDILVKLAAGGAEPRSLTSFVVTSFRNHVTDRRRESAARDRYVREQRTDERADQVAAAGCSEFMLRAAEGPWIDETKSPSAELVEVLFARCSVQDRQLLVWSTHRVPLRECAAWLGISYDSAKQRLSRVRARLLRDSVAHLSQLGEADRALLVRLLRRTGVKVDNDNTRGTAA